MTLEKINNNKKIHTIDLQQEKPIVKEDNNILNKNHSSNNKIDKKEEMCLIF